MPKPALCISDKMLMSFNGWNPELLNMNHGQNIVSIMSRFTCKKKIVFCLIYYNDNTLCFINICWLYENINTDKERVFRGPEHFV